MDKATNIFISIIVATVITLIVASIDPGTFESGTPKPRIISTFMEGLLFFFAVSVLIFVFLNDINKTLVYKDSTKQSASKSVYGKVIGILALGLILIIVLMPRVENATYRAKCEFYSTTSGANWDKSIDIEYTTGMFWNQSFTINHHIKLEDVSTFKGHAEGTIYRGYRGKQANFVYDEVYKSLYIEIKLNQKYSDDERIHALVRYNCK